MGRWETRRGRGWKTRWDLRLRSRACGQFRRRVCRYFSFWCNLEKREGTYDSRPRTSEILCPSFRTLVLIWPMELTKWTPIIHSSTESSTSRAKSWRCLMREERTSRLRASVLGPIVSMQCWVKLRSNLDCAIVMDEGF
jgi:hypothetical protein